jgi:Xaa-Pro aminopeptidase
MKLADIQQALRQEGLDGWLFYDHHQRDPLAYRILGLPQDLVPTRRWYYLVPSHGEPRALVHSIEPHMLDSLPGSKMSYARWAEKNARLRDLLQNARRVAMQYSPNCAVPYVAMVDAGTVELIRSLGVEVAGSANLVQLFEARWSDDQLEMHLEAGRRMDSLRAEAFAFIGNRLRGGSITEWDVRKFLLDRFAETKLVTDHGPIVGVNANASNPHYEPTPDFHHPIHPGDVVLIDMWAKLDQLNAVYYDITWTGVCAEEAPEEVLLVFHIVREARDRAIRLVQDAVASGRVLHGFEVDDAARAYINEQGFGAHFFHRTGHSIGTNVHGAGANMDNFETHDDRSVIPGTCFSVEPGIYLEKFGIRSEVNLYVGETEARVTGAAQAELVRIR